MPAGEGDSRFRALFEQSAISMQLLDRQGRTLQVNRAWERLWQGDAPDGRLKAYVLSDQYNFLTDPQLQEKGLAALIRQALSGTPVTLPPMLYDPARQQLGKQKRWVTVQLHPITNADGEVLEVMLTYQDVSQQLEAKQRMALSEARFRSLVTATSQVVWIAAPDGQIREDSPSWRLFTGSSYEQGCGEGWLNWLHPDDREQTRTLWLDCLAREVLYETEYRLRNQDGDYRWVSVKGVPIFNPQGQVREWIGTNNDIDDARRSVDVLRESEDRLHFALEAAGMVAWDVNLNTGLAKHSLMAQDMWSLPDGPVEHFASTIHHEDRQAVMDLFERARQGKAEYVTEFRILTPDHREIWLHEKAQLRTDPVYGHRHMIGISLDITERKHNEQALRLSEARFRMITDSLPQMVWTAFADGHHDYYNRQWYLFTGMAEGSTYGAGWSKMFHADDREHAWELWHHSLVNGTPYEIQYRLRHHSGEYRWVLGRGLPMRDEHGIIRRWLGTCTDIHDQKLAEQRLQEADRRKDEFLAMLSHELRNPLAPISAAAEMLQMAPLAPERVRYISDVLGRQVQHMKALVDDLMDVSRVTRGLVEITQAPQDLQEVIANSLEQVRTLIDHKHQHLHLELSPEPAHVRGDKKRLVQVLTNLLSNAARYTPAGGNIHLSLTVQEALVILSVSDDGQGIAPDLAPQIFDLFIQAERDADRSQGGLGIGLALVKSLVELHAGQVSCHSAGPGQGSRFVIKLPRLRASPESDLENQAAAGMTAALKPLTILVVDDNIDAGQMLALFLQMAGHQVMVEHHAWRALEHAALLQPQVCVLDIGLPDMDGYELARRLRARPETAGAILIAVTGYGQKQDQAQARAAGFSHHLVKPVDAAELTALLADLVPQAR